MNRATAYTGTQRASFNTPAARSTQPAKKGPQSAATAAPLERLVLLADDDLRRQTKQTIGLALEGFSRSEIAELTGISESRLDNITRETGHKNGFIYELGPLTAATGRLDLLRWVAEQVGCDVDAAAVVELGRLSREIALLERRRAELLSEVA